MSGRIAVFCSLLLLLPAIGSGAAAQPHQVSHPTELPLPALEFTPPPAERYRSELANGLVAYLASDRRFPLVTLRAWVRAGSLADPDGQVGLSRLLSTFLRSAATTRHSADEIQAILDRAAADLRVTSDAASIRLEPPPVSDPLPDPERKIYLIHQPGLRKAFGLMGHRGVRFDNPDYFPVQLMNWILTGGKVYQGYGAFSGRIFFQLRTSRGISSQGFGEFEDPFHYPPAFAVYWNGREEKAGEALSLVFREVDRLRREPVSALELATARNFFLYGLPSQFHSAAAAVETLGQLDFDRAPLHLYSRLQKDVGRTTAEDVLRVARDHIRPERLLTVILGDADRILAAAQAGGFPIQEFGPLEVVRPPQ